MVINHGLNEWIGTHCSSALKAFDEAIAQLNLTSAEQAEVRANMTEVVRQYLPTIVRGLALIAALHPCHRKDRRYFKRHGINECNSDDLAQNTAAKILKALFYAWPRLHLGAWRSKIRSNVLTDHARELRVEKQYVEYRDPDSFPDRSDPVLEREHMEYVLRHCSDLERKIIAARINGDAWVQIGDALGIPAATVRKIARRSRSSKSLRKCDGKKFL